VDTHGARVGAQNDDPLGGLIMAELAEGGEAVTAADARKPQEDTHPADEPDGEHPEDDEGCGPLDDRVQGPLE